MDVRTLLRGIKEERNFYLLLLAIIALALLLLYFSESEIVREVGKALFVAAILAASVDSTLKERFAKDVAKKVSPYIMSHTLPQELQGEVAEICGIKLYRTDFELKYELSILEEDPNAVLVACTLNYSVVNLLDEHTEYSHFVWVEKSLGKEKHIIEPICDVGADNVYNKKGENISYNHYEVTPILSPGAFAWKNLVYLPPRDSPPATFWQTTYQVFPLQRYEPFITTVAIVGRIPDKGVRVGPKVTVSSPDSLEVNVTFEHRLEEDLDRYRKGSDTEVWEFRHALLPFSTIAVTWQPKATQ